jgi:hypothetical protein
MNNELWPLPTKEQLAALKRLGVTPQDVFILAHKLQAQQPELTLSEFQVRLLDAVTELALKGQAEKN